MLKRITSWLGRLNFRYLFVGGLLLVSVFVVYFWRLSNLTKGLSPAESSARASSASIHTIINNPVDAPQRLLQFAAQRAGYYHAFSMRLASVICAVIFVACIFWVMKTWFGLTIGIFGSLLFATTPLVVLSARSATTDVMFLMPCALLAAYVRLVKHQRKPDWAWLTIAFVAGLCLYVPGMIWLILGSLIVLRKRVVELAHSINRKMLFVSLVMILLLLSPIAWALIKNLSVYHQLLLVPPHWPGVVNSFKSVGWSALALGWHTRAHVPLIIDRLSILSAVQLSLVVFGGYVMWSRARREMAALMALVILAIVLAGINNNFLVLGLSLPALCILSAAGLRYLYIEWRSIFPRNPLPLSLALMLISSLVGLQVAYGLRYSLVAWPHTPATKKLYVLK
jgi:4-amino-4-deoxy-L-arabinose transferase-like glycosyltransferase